MKQAFVCGGSWAYLNSVFEMVVIGTAPREPNLHEHEFGPSLSSPEPLMITTLPPCRPPTAGVADSSTTGGWNVKVTTLDGAM